MSEERLYRACTFCPLVATLLVGCWLSAAETVVRESRAGRRAFGRADLEGADLRRASFKDADLRGANLRNADLRNVNLEGADLSAATAAKRRGPQGERPQEAQRTNLEGANLGGANLQNANLEGANLAGANLSGADLGNANFSGTNLARTNLAGADLEGADLRFARHLKSVQLDHACGSSNTLLPLGLSLRSCRGDATVGRHEWSTHFGGAAREWTNGVAADAAGNVYVTGIFSASRTWGSPVDKTVSLGGENLTSIGEGSGDVFLTSYDASGAHRWSKHFGSTNHTEILDVAADMSGNVYVTGRCEGTVNLGGEDLRSALTRGWDMFVASYDNKGVHRWSKRFGHGPAEGASLAVDADGRLYVTGSFNGNVSFGGRFLTAKGDRDIFIVSFDGTGAHRWSKRFGAFKHDVGRGVAVDASGNVYVTGAFETFAVEVDATDAVNFGGEDLKSPSDMDELHTAGPAMFIASFDPAGVHRWSLGFGSVWPAEAAGKYSPVPIGTWVSGFDVAADKEGNTFVAGVFTNVVNFGGEDLMSQGTRHSEFIASFSVSGTHRWSRRLRGTHVGQAASDVAVDPYGNVYLAGEFGGGRTSRATRMDVVNLGGEDLVSASEDAWNIFVVSYDTSGGHRWSRCFGNPEFTATGDVELDASGTLYLTGQFRGTVNLGGEDLKSAGATDFFVAAFN